MALSTNLDYILGLPFKVYKTFKIEQDFGFNKSTVRLFIRDQMLTLTLTTIIGGTILYCLLQVIEWGGSSFVFYVTVFFVVVIILMSTIYPNLIQPLFNKFDELQEGSLKDKIYQKAQELKFPLTKIYVCDASKRSAHSNAYMYGFWWNKRIVLFDTLVNQCQEDEIMAVMTHEFGHWKFGHTLIGIVISLVNITVIFYLFSFTLNRKDLLDSFLFTDYYDSQGKMSIMLGLYVFMELYTPINFATQFLFTSITRKMEYQADQFAKSHGFRDLMKSALIKLFVENSGNMNPDPLYATINFSHPTLTERIRALDKSKQE